MNTIRATQVNAVMSISGNENPHKILQPIANCYVTSDVWAVYIECPGVPKENFKIELTDTLSISGKTMIDDHFYYCKSKALREGTFSAKYTLPGNINRDKIIVKYEHGILKITIPTLDALRVTVK